MGLFSKAVKHDAKLRLAIAGPSGRVTTLYHYKEFWRQKIADGMALELSVSISDLY